MKSCEMIKTMLEADDKEIQVLAKAIFDGLKEDGVTFESYRPIDWVVLSIRSTARAIFKGSMGGWQA